jgi:hypothetical protein
MKDLVYPRRRAASLSAPRASAVVTTLVHIRAVFDHPRDERQAVATDLGADSAYSSASDHTFSEPRKPLAA